MSTAVASTRVTTAPRAIRRWFYIGVAVLMGLTAVAGFWPTYFGPLVRGSLHQPLVIHVHAAVFVGWLVLLLTQVSLAATGRVAWHQRLGRWGIAYGGLVLVVGVATGILRAAHRVVTGGNANVLLYIASLDMILFATFFGAAIFYRRKTQLHKRLMVVAATVLLVAAVFRLPIYPAGPMFTHLRLLAWSVPILLAIGYDVKHRRSFHPVYALGLLGLIVRTSCVPLSQTDVWSVVTAWATSLVL